MKIHRFIKDSKGLANNEREAIKQRNTAKKKREIVPKDSGTEESNEENETQVEIKTYKKTGKKKGGEEVRGD